MKNERLKSWPHWKRSNAGLYLAGLATYAGLYGLLCYVAHPRIVFLILTIVAASSTFTLLWSVIQHKDQHEQ